MEEREHPRVMPGIEVFDVDGHKIGTVTHVHERAPAAAGATVATASATTAVGNTGGAAGADGGVFEVKTGLFGLGKHYFIPFSAVKDVTVGGVFVNRAKADLDTTGWDRKPDLVAHPDRVDQVVSPDRPTEVARPAEGMATSAAAPTAGTAAASPTDTSDSTRASA